MMQRPSHGPLALLGTAAAVTVGKRVIGKVRVSRPLFGRHALLASTSLSTGNDADIDTPAQPVTEASSSDCNTGCSDPHPNPQQSPNDEDGSWNNILWIISPVQAIFGFVVIWFPGTKELGAISLVGGMAGCLREEFKGEISKLDSKLGKLQESVNTLLMDKAAREAVEKSKKRRWRLP